MCDWGHKELWECLSRYPPSQTRESATSDTTVATVICILCIGLFLAKNELKWLYILLPLADLFHPWALQLSGEHTSGYTLRGTTGNSSTIAISVHLSTDIRLHLGEQASHSRISRGNGFNEPSSYHSTGIGIRGLCNHPDTDLRLVRKLAERRECKIRAAIYINM